MKKTIRFYNGCDRPRTGSRSGRPCSKLAVFVDGTKITSCTTAHEPTPEQLITTIKKAVRKAAAKLAGLPEIEWRPRRIIRIPGRE